MKGLFLVLAICISSVSYSQTYLVSEFPDSTTTYNSCETITFDVSSNDAALRTYRVEYSVDAGRTWKYISAPRTSPGDWRTINFTPPQTESDSC